MSLSSQSTSFFGMSRNKPLSSSGSSSSSKRDKTSLYRSVLVKNYLTRSQFPPAEKAPSAVQYVYRQDEPQGEARVNEEANAFVFPDPGALAGSRNDASELESQWLDSLLESLGRDEEFDNEVASGLPADEDDELLSPLYSPMSSSDDLVGQSDLYAIAVPYPVPYPPIHTASVPAWFELAPSFSPSSSPNSVSPVSSPYDDDPLPYHYVDDLDDMPVPDAIEDTSDDESDVPSTPSTQSTSSMSPSSTHPDSVPVPVLPPTPPERRPLHSRPHVYINVENSYFYPFRFDSFSPADGRNDSVRAYHSPIFQDC